MIYNPASSYSKTTDGVHDEASDRLIRLRQAVKQAGGNLKVAQKSGIPLSTLNSYMSGRELKLSTALELCKVCNITIEWLTTGQTQYNSVLAKTVHHLNTQYVHYELGNSLTEAPQGCLSIPFYQIALTSYQDIINRKNVHGFCYFEKNWLENTLVRPSEFLLAITGIGHTMEPTLRHQDLILVDTSSTHIIEGAIYILSINQTILIKRIVPLASGHLQLVNDNDRYPPQILDQNASQQIVTHILGQAIWHSGMLI